MAEGKILTRNIRFPKDNLPDYGFNPNKLPQWLAEIDVTYDDTTLVDGKGKYTIIRKHGPAAGDTKTPVYMDLDGQPQPITDLADSIVRSGNLARRFSEIIGMISGAQVTVSENSPFLNIVETHGENNVNYEVKETISTFLTRSQDNVSILDNFVIHEIPSVGGISVSLGEGLIATTKNQMILGQFNKQTTSPFAIGNGTNKNNRSNLFEINTDGDIIVSGEIKKANGTPQGTVYVGATEPIDSNTVVWINPNA